MFIPGWRRERLTRRSSRRPTDLPISALIRNISIREIISGSRRGALIIREDQNLNASFTNGLAGNPSNQLSEARAYASLAYGNNNRVVLTGQYFTSWGTIDPILGNPGTKGWIAEIAYIPFISNQAPGWPWFNARIGLQYTWYDEFGGTTVGASANNTLFLYVWVAM